ncbi:LysM peptidoglycan-binding domain-containing protein [Bordetella avium]|uniref:FecR family protein n=1 Tax=Bordetella avium TaxID=521 RepID=UPI000E69E848|nr:FecR domain-containing protein [Bordetella avium]RIQ72362.1 LysM peptidoglycan-binding domain-containing protein [Bordetella avium]
MHRSFRRAPLMLSVALATTAVHAQPAGTLNEDFIHRVRPGDTLSGLAASYTGKESHWQVLQQLNAIGDTHALPVARELRIPLAMIPEVASSAQVTSLTGKAGLDGQELKEGSAVSEGGLLTTGPNSFMTLRLSDDSEIALPPNSAVSLQRLRRFKHMPITDTVLSVERGAMESKVAPDGGGVGRFEIRSPVAVTGVRGTRFRVEASSNGASQAVLEGNVRVQAHTPGQKPEAPITVHQGQGARIGSDGSVLGLRPLLPAPALGTPRRAEGGWTALVTPVAGAQAYNVRVSRDNDGMQVIAAKQYNTPDIRFAAPGPGTYYVNVSAIDEFGLAGYEARQTFEGTLALLSTDDKPVLSGTGEIIALQTY